MVADTKLYDILGCKPDATERELKKAFMVKARMLHPDKNKDDPNATEKFQELNEAYEVLKNPETREMYDKYGPEGLKEGGGMQFDDILSHIFGFPMGGMGGMGGHEMPRTRDIVKEIPATLEELYNGASKKVTIDRHTICPVCNGTGCKGGAKPKVCPKCNGQGQVLETKNIPGMGLVQTVETCPKCHGDGSTIDNKDKCDSCDGDTVVRESKEFICQIERGMEDGSRIVFTGESDAVPGAEQGDVVIVVREEAHPVFERRHNDLLYKMDVNLYEALFGATFIIETLDDRKLLVKTTPGEVIKPETVKVIENEGMPERENPYSRGKLFIKFNVVFPDPSVLTEELRQQLAIICPPAQLPECEEEDLYTTRLQDAEIEEFTKNKGTHGTRRNEAYNSDGYDDDIYSDYEEDYDGEGQSCQPM